MVSSKERLRARALDALAEKGPRSRADLARELEISRATSSIVINDLMQEGLIEEIAARETSGAPGRPGARLALKASGDFLLGVDFGRLSLRVGLSDLSYRLLRHEACAFDIDVPSDRALDRAAERVEALIEASGVDRRRIPRGRRRSAGTGRRGRACCTPARSWRVGSARTWRAA